MNNLNLKEQGFRFLVSQNRKDCGWVHPAEIAFSGESDWVDCTEMNDAEFDAFMSVSISA